MDVIALLKAVQSAYEDVQAKQKARDDAGTKYHAAVTAHDAAVSELKAKQGELNQMLGAVSTDPRFRQSA